jgi:hypothetical protein
VRTRVSRGERARIERTRVLKGGSRFKRR